MELSKGNTAAAGTQRPGAAPGEGELRAAIGNAGFAVRRFLFGMCGNWDRAEDLAQEVLLKAWRKRESFDGRAKVTTWVFAIARNHWLDRLRRKRTSPRTEPMNEDMYISHVGESPSAAAGRGELARAVGAALTTLPPEQREALAMRESESLSFVQIAHVLSIPVSTAKSRVRYALLKLADELKPFRSELES